MERWRRAMGKEKKEIPADVLADADQFVCHLEDMLDKLVEEIRRMSAQGQRDDDYDRTQVIMIMGTALGQKLDPERLGYVLAVTLMRIADPRAEMTV